MILIFGGMYQGKRSYAFERFNLTEDELLLADEWIFKLVKADADVDGAVRKFIAENPGAIVICNDISCGVVPVDPLLRKWREAVGRALAIISKESDEVIRMFCGIPTRIK